MVHYLVRHGQAEGGVVDRERPLSARGHADIGRVARAAAGRGVRIGVVWHSGLRRARETAEILATELARGARVEEMPGLGPDDDPAFVREVLSAAVGPVLVVGHLPHLGRLTAALLAGREGDGPVTFDPGTMVAVRREPDGWRLEWVLAPGLAGPHGPGAPSPGPG